jgi:hypothetical protein
MTSQKAKKLFTVHAFKNLWDFSKNPIVAVE